MSVTSHQDPKDVSYQTPELRVDIADASIVSAMQLQAAGVSDRFKF